MKIGKVCCESFVYYIFFNVDFEGEEKDREFTWMNESKKSRVFLKTNEEDFIGREKEKRKKKESNEREISII